MKKSSKEGNMNNMCFVLSPFKEPFDTDYRKILRAAIKDAGLNPLRADEIYGAKPIMDDIRMSIKSARIILAEMTGRNPNVLYEVGLAHAIGTPVVMITQSKKDIPFDLNQIRYIAYQRIKPNWASLLRADIKQSLLATLSDKPIPNPAKQWTPQGCCKVGSATQDELERLKRLRAVPSSAIR